MRYFGVDKKMNTKDKYVKPKVEPEKIFEYTLDISYQVDSRLEDLGSLFRRLSNNKKNFFEYQQHVENDYMLGSMKFKYKCSSKVEKLLRARIREMGYIII